MEELPKYINAMKVISYDVEQMVEDVCKAYRISQKEVTRDMIMEYLEELVKEDFAYRDYTGDVIFQDENGEEL